MDVVPCHDDCLQVHCVTRLFLRCPCIQNHIMLYILYVRYLTIYNVCNAAEAQVCLQI